MAKKKLPHGNPKPQRSRRKKGNAGRAVLTVIIVALLTVIIGIYLLTKYSEKIPPYLIPKKIFKPEMKTVNLYFSNDEGLALKAEKREIAKGALAKEIERSINALIKGPAEKLTPTIPDGTRLLGVEIKEGVAFLNFSKEISERHPGGSSAEIQTVYSIVNTVALNFSEIKKVQLLIEGKKAKTVAGHIDISFPLKADKEFIKG
ncbi:MAG: GerMN domain-containing protein [Deltaproteobacteria bacterium]|nr:GerMN domain-containing protein [Deltaproteobacteria bacterium]